GSGRAGRAGGRPAALADGEVRQPRRGAHERGEPAPRDQVVAGVFYGVDQEEEVGEEPKIGRRSPNLLPFAAGPRFDMVPGPCYTLPTFPRRFCWRDGR